MNLADILVGGLVAAALLVALFFMSKKSDSGCSGSCSSCSMSGSCHKKEGK